MKKIALIISSLLSLAVLSAQTVHTCNDTIFDGSSEAYYVQVTTTTTASETTIGYTITEGTMTLNSVSSVVIYKNTVPRITGRVSEGTGSHANGVGSYVDDDANTLVPTYYCLKLNGPGKSSSRTIPAIYLPNAPDAVITDPCFDEGGTSLISSVYPNPDDSTVTVKFECDDYAYFQSVILAAKSPLMPAGDKPVFFSNVLLNSDAVASGRTDIGFGSVFWGHEGPTYLQMKVDASYISSDTKSYMWLKTGRPSGKTSDGMPIAINLKPNTATSIDNSKTHNDIVLFAGKSQITVSSSSIAKLTIYTISGQLVSSQLISEGTSQLSISSGVYITKVVAGNTVKVQKLLVK